MLDKGLQFSVRSLTIKSRSSVRSLFSHSIKNIYFFIQTNNSNRLFGSGFVKNFYKTFFSLWEVQGFQSQFITVQSKSEILVSQFSSDQLDSQFFCLASVDFSSILRVIYSHFGSIQLGSKTFFVPVQLNSVWFQNLFYPVKLNSVWFQNFYVPVQLNSVRFQNFCVPVQFNSVWF